MLQVYFDGLYEGDTKKLGEAFHPASHLYSAAAADGNGRGHAARRLVQDGGRAASRPRTSGSERRDRIVSIDFSGPATAFREGRVPDPAALLHGLSDPSKVEGRWQVIAKAFHTVTETKTRQTRREETSSSRPPRPEP